MWLAKHAILHTHVKHLVLGAHPHLSRLHNLAWHGTALTHVVAAHSCVLRMAFRDLIVDLSRTNRKCAHGMAEPALTLFKPSLWDGWGTVLILWRRRRAPIGTDVAKVQTHTWVWPLSDNLVGVHKIFRTAPSSRKEPLAGHWQSLELD
jgi:hypothetical protein